MEIGGLVASTRRTAWDSSEEKIWNTACIAASHPEMCPAQTCRGAADSWMTDSLKVLAMALQFLCR